MVLLLELTSRIPLLILHTLYLSYYIQVYIGQGYLCDFE